MVSNPLHYIPCHSGIKEGNGQIHQLDKKIGYQGNIYPGTKVEQDPTTEHLYTCPSKKQHHLCYQYQIDKSDILVLDTNINNTLGQKWKNQLEQTAHQQTNT